MSIRPVTHAGTEALSPRPASITAERPPGSSARWYAPVLGLVAMLPFIVRRVGDPDDFWHIRTGQWIVQNHTLARSDLYTYTIPGTSWTDHEYGSQLIFYVLDRLGGFLAISIAFAAAYWAGFWAVLARIRQRPYSPFVAGASLFLGAAAGFPDWNPRPEVFDFLFGAVELYWLERFMTRGSRAIWWLPLLVIPWANVHGGFIFAFFFLGLCALALLIQWIAARDRGTLRAFSHLVVIGVLSALAALITPWGPGLYVYVFKTQFSSQLSGFVAEWQSPDFHMVEMLPFGLMALLVLAGFAWKRPRLHDVLLVVGSLALAMRAWFFIPIFVLAATPVLTWQWSEPWLALRQRMRWSALLSDRVLAGAVLAVVAVAAIGAAAYTLRGQTASTNANYPVAAANWLAAHPAVGTRVFNEYAWGGYMIARFYPDPNRRVFIYGETELMGDTLLARYVDVNQLHPNWRQVLDSYGVDYVLFPAGRPLDAALGASPAWRLAYADSVADIFVRRSSSST